MSEPGTQTETPGGEQIPPVSSPRSASLSGWYRLVRADLAVALLSILYFIVPLYRTAILEDSFLIPKLALVQWLSLATLAVVLARIVRHGRSALVDTREHSASGPRRGAPSPFPKDWIGYLLVVWVAVHGVSALWARSGALAATEIGYLVSFLALYFACSWGLRSTKSAGAVIACGIAAATVTAAWVLGEDALRQQNPAGFMARLPDWRGFLAAGLGNSGHIAGAIGLFLPAAIIAFLSAPRFRPVLFAAIGLMFAGLVVTWSVGSTGATVLSLVIWGALAAGLPSFALRRELRWKRLGALVAIGAAAVAFYYLPHPLNPHSPSLWTEAFSSERWKEGGPTRAVIYKTTWEMIRQNPLRGVGAGNFTLEYVRQVVPSVVGDPHLRIYAGGFTNDAHNEYLQMWSEAGVFAPLAWLLLLALFFVRVVSLLRNPLVDLPSRLVLLSAGAGVTVFVLDSLMTFPIRLPAHFAALMLWLAVPAVVSRTVPVKTGRRRRKRGEEPSAPTGTGRMPLVAGCVLLLLALSAAAANHTRRVAAAYYLKEGRTTAETTPVQLGGQLVPLWSAAEYHFNQATQAVAAGNEAAARQFFNIASVMAKEDAMQQAEASFRRALSWDGRYADARSRLGSVLLMRGEPNEAAAETLRTLRDLESSEIWERLGFALWLKGDKKGAAEAWKVPAERRPVQADYFRALIAQAGK